MKYWTNAGVNRLSAEIEALRGRICQERADKLQIGAHRHGSQESPSDALLWSSLLTQKQALFESITPLGKPLQSVTGQVGLEIGIEHLDEEIQAKRGRNELFILGGVGEDDSSASPRVISCASSIGVAIVGAKVGEIVEIRWPNQLETEARVTRIAVPQDEKPADPAAKTAAEPALASS